jgi:poly(3-hydroxybutyrate) depolymerase
VRGLVENRAAAGVVAGSASGRDPEYAAASRSPHATAVHAATCGADTGRGYSGGDASG